MSVIRAREWIGVGALLGLALMAVPGQAQQTVDQNSAEDACAFSTVLDLRTGLPTTSDRLYGEARGAQLVFVGERHGTAEHVQLAACILSEKAGSRPPVLALEHVPASAQRALDDWRRDSAFDADLFAEVVAWESLGWPDFEIYRPLIETAGTARAHVLGTDRPQPGAGGPSADALIEVAPAYGLQSDDVVEAWIPDMIAGHCDLIGEDAASRMALVQMERDRIMAGRLIAGRGRGISALYFGGRGHVRRDRAIPYLMDRTDRPPTMLVVAAFTQDEWSNQLANDPAAAMQNLALAYDVVVVAGQSDPTDEQLCNDMRAQMGLPPQ
ncbi:MAG: hypothetical protein Rhims3KO_31320 [Hyphomicrobiales bacterium]